MRQCLILLYLLLPYVSPAQVRDTIFYNNRWRISTHHDAVFYRVAEVDTTAFAFVGAVSDYYGTGELFMRGNYTKEGKKNGEFIWYHGNGRPFMKGSFSNDTVNGVWEMYFPDGVVKQRIQFENNEFVFLDLLDESKKLLIGSGNGQLKNTEIGVNPTLLLQKAEMQDGERAGKWIFRYQSSMGLKEYVEEYRDGTFYIGYARNVDPKEKHYSSLLTPELYEPPNLKIMERFEADRAYRGKYYRRKDPVDGRVTSFKNARGEEWSVVEEQPEYPGGMGEFYRMISQNLQYPKEARKMGLEGKVMVQFVVAEDGSLTEFAVVRGLGGGCDEEALRVVKLSEKWLPGRQRGKPVKVRMIIPISFSR